MTKTNKTLLCVLLAMVLTFALALTALTTTAQTATAEGETLVATFNCGTDGTAGHADGSNKTSYTETSGEYTISITGTNMYTGAKDEKGNGALKFGTSKKDGDMTITVPEGIVLAKVYVAGYKKTATKVSVNDATASSSVSGLSDNGTYDAIDVPITNKQGKIAFTARAMVDKIELYVAGVSCEHDLVEVPAVAATCTEAGNNAYYKCNLCGKFFADAEAATATTAEAQATPPLGHKYDWTLDTENTQYKDGVCSVCGHEDTDSSAIANIYVNGVLLTGNNKEGTITIGNQTGLVASIGNDPVYPGSKPTLTITNIDGTLNYIVSNLDGDNLIVDDSTLMATIAVPAELMDEFRITVTVNCAHTAKVKHNKVEATCLAEGTEEYWKCPACGVLSSTEDMATVISAPKTIAKVAHGSEGCTHTAEEIIVLNAYDLGTGATLGEYTLTGVYRVVSKKSYLEVGSLSDKRIMLYNGKLAAGSETPVDGDTITVTGTIKNYNGTIEFDTPTYSKVTVVASKFEVSQSITAGDGAKQATDEATDITTIYVKNGSQIVVTYKITANDGINTFIATLKYNKAFSIVSVTITDGFGAGAAIKSGNVGVTDYKVYIEGDGDGYTANYTGEFVTVVYQFNGDTTATINASDFGLDHVTCYTNHASGFVDAEVTIGTSNEVFDFIKQSSITLNDQAADSQIEVTYNAKELTVDLALNNPTLVVKSESTGKLVCKWYSDAARTTEIAAPTNVGTYYLTVTIEATPAYEQSTANFTIVINPYQIDYDALSVSANPNDKALVGGTATWAESDIVVGGLAGLPDATGVYTITYGTLSFTTVGEKEISVIVTITNANYKFVSASGFAEGDSETVYNGKATVSVSAKAISLVLPTLEDKYYDGKAISLAGIAASVEGESLTVSVEVTVNGTVLTSEELATYIVNAGTYNIAVRAWVEGNDNYKQVTGNLSVEIKKLTLFIDASKIVYNGSIVSWEAVTKAYKANDTELVDIADLGVTVTYQVTNGEGHDYDGSTSFDANSLETVAQLTLKAIPNDTTNFNVGSQGLKMVYQVLFAASTEPAVAESKVNVFEGEVVSAPSVSAEGYRFDAWYNGETAYDFTAAVTTNLTLVAKWVKQITITWYNEDGTSVLKTVTADVDTTAKFDLDAPTKAATDYIDYAFEKWVDTTDATKLYDLAYEFTLTADISVKATFKGTVARMSVSYKVIGGDGNVLEEGDLGINDVGTTPSNLPSPRAYKWFDISAWMNGETEFTTVVADELDGAHKIELVATYKFIIGLGDVDGNGNVDTDDIVLYRKHIVGGYDITLVSDAWTTATAEGFDENKVYFLAQVANVDDDASNTNDVRDVSTIRMALVGGYGYTVDEEGKAVVKGNAATTQSARVQYKQVLAPMGLFGKKFAL